VSNIWETSGTRQSWRGRATHETRRSQSRRAPLKVLSTLSVLMLLLWAFVFLFRAESVGEALSIVLELLAKLPTEIFYDVACKLEMNAMGRVRPLVRAQSVRCILDRPHAITHSCSPTYFPDEYPGTTVGVASQAAEVSHLIAVLNRNSLAYMSSATYMTHRMIQVAFMILGKLYRLHEDNGVGENYHVPRAPFFHIKISHQCERVTV